MSVGGSGTATAAGPTTAMGRSMPFMMWGAPSALGIQQTSTYNPGSSARVAQAVSPTVTALGPPAKAIHGGGGVWFFIAAVAQPDERGVVELLALIDETQRGEPGGDGSVASQQH